LVGDAHPRWGDENRNEGFQSGNETRLVSRQLIGQAAGD